MFGNARAKENIGPQTQIYRFQLLPEQKETIVRG